MPIYLNLDIIEMLSAFASKEKTRCHLWGVYVDSANNSYVATNGHIMGAYEDESAGACPIPLTIPFSKELAAAERAARKQYRFLNCKTMWLVLPDDVAPGKRSLAHVVADKETPLDDAPLVQITPINGPFPGWTNVLPSSFPAEEKRPIIGLNALYMEAFALGEKPNAMGDDACITLIATGGNENGTADRTVIALNNRHERFFGLIMPMRHAGESELLSAAPLALRRSLGLVPAPAVDSAPASAAA